MGPAEEALRIAGRRGVSIVKAPGEHLPFLNGSFGTVFLLFTLCFVEDPGQVFSEAGRVLKKGGGLIVGVINRESPWGQLYLKKKAGGHPIYRHATFYSVNEVVKMMEKTGFAIEAFASTLCQLPTQTVNRGPVYEELMEKAGFVGILGKLP
ncbi:MAG: class I SAM-dependent methyltransferase [Desulforhabdus sp.]|nr:class I SAM-dependent methyltransferase [Desulforhabdus sp.]